MKQLNRMPITAFVWYLALSIESFSSENLAAVDAKVDRLRHERATHAMRQ